MDVPDITTLHQTHHAPQTEPLDGGGGGGERGREGERVGVGWGGWGRGGMGERGERGGGGGEGWGVRELMGHVSGSVGSQVSGRLCQSTSKMAQPGLIL